MCFATRLDPPEQMLEAMCSEVDNEGLAANMADGCQASPESSSMYEKSSKRSLPTALGDEPPLKRSKTSDIQRDTIGIVEIEDHNRQESPPMEVSATNNGETDQHDDGVAEKFITERANDAATEEAIQKYRDKANKLLTAKRQLIREMRGEIEDLKADRDVWREKAILIETSEKTLQEHNKKFLEDVRKKINIAIKEEHASKLQNEKAKHDEILEAKETAFRRKINAKERKHIEEVEMQDKKIETLELDLRESKANAKQAERELKAQHKEELKKYKPEHSDAVKEQKLEVKSKQAALDKLTKEMEDLRKEGEHYQTDWSVIKDRNDKLQEMVRTNSKKVIELQGEVEQWKKNATAFREARDQLREDFASKLKHRDNDWHAAMDKERIEREESLFRLADARRGNLLLNQTHDRNILRIRSLEMKIAALEAKLNVIVGDSTN